MTYLCSYCDRTFSTSLALKRHISDKHQYIDEEEGATSQSRMLYEEEPGLWDDDFPTEETGLWDDDQPTKDQFMVRLR